VLSPFLKVGKNCSDIHRSTVNTIMRENNKSEKKGRKILYVENEKYIHSFT
jgi:hypothetical protein